MCEICQQSVSVRCVNKGFYFWVHYAGVNSLGCGVKKENFQMKFVFNAERVVSCEAMELGVSCRG